MIVDEAFLRTQVVPPCFSARVSCFSEFLNRLMFIGIEDLACQCGGGQHWILESVVLLAKKKKPHEMRKKKPRCGTALVPTVGLSTELGTSIGSDAKSASGGFRCTGFGDPSWICVGHCVGPTLNKNSSSSSFAEKTSFHFSSATDLYQPAQEVGSSKKLSSSRSDSVSLMWLRPTRRIGGS